MSNCMDGRVGHWNSIMWQAYQNNG